MNSLATTGLNAATTTTPHFDQPAYLAGMDNARVSFHLRIDPASALRYLTDAELLTEWWPDEAETDPRVGGTYRLHWSRPGVTLRGEYRTVDQQARLAFTWVWDHEDLPARLVVIDLTEASDGGTDLLIDHEAETAQEREDYEAGWSHFLGRLSLLVR